MAMEKDDLKERIHALETAQATQTATTTGMQATQAAMQAGTWTTIGAGAASLIVGIFLGIAISKAKG